MSIVIVGAVALVAFALGRMSAQREIRDLRADVEQWATLSNELHDENCELRKAAL